MAGIAAIARELGHKVTGSDHVLYPPMSIQLQQLGIDVRDLDDSGQFFDHPDQVVIGNALSRGQTAVEYVLNQRLDYLSGPEWLARNVLPGRWVLAVAGTHGKTTTSSMLAWILEHAGLQPGFLIGGIPGNFPCSARLGHSPFFVIEADEYDTAFFDKRSKFVHYCPQTAVLHNLEYDHADIFDNVEAIIRQFHHLVRTVPGKGRILVNGQDRNIAKVLTQGYWSELQNYAVLPAGKSLAEQPADWCLRHSSAVDETLHEVLAVYYQQHCEVSLDWSIPGQHNAMNALAAVAAAYHAGVSTGRAVKALQQFVLPKRRLELLLKHPDVHLYDDFAHHPTAIKYTLACLKKRHGGRLLALFEPRSNSMRMGVHREQLTEAFNAADRLFVLEPPTLDWNVESTLQRVPNSLHVFQSPEQLLHRVLAEIQSGDTVCCLSNGGFSGIPGRLLALLENRVLDGM